MFTSATGYIFSFGLSRRRHEPPFKPGGSVGALVGRPGFRAGFARIRARGRGRGSVGAACSSGKKPLDLPRKSSSHLIYSLAWPPPVTAAPCSPAYCVFPTTECAQKANTRTAPLAEKPTGPFPADRAPPRPRELAPDSHRRGGQGGRSTRAGDAFRLPEPACNKQAKSAATRGKF